MKHEVGGFAQQLAIARRDSGQRGFHAFLAHLLRHAPHAGLEQARGVAASGTLRMARRHQRVQFGQEPKRWPRVVAEAAPGTEVMSGSSGPMKLEVKN